MHTKSGDLIPRKIKLSQVDVSVGNITQILDTVLVQLGLAERQYRQMIVITQDPQ